MRAESAPAGAGPWRSAATWEAAFLMLAVAAGFLSVAVSQMALGLALLTFLYRLVVRHGQPPVTGLEITAALLAGWALLMVPLSTDVAQSALYYRRFYLFTAIWLTADVAVTEKRRRLLLAYLMAGALATCLHDQILHVLRTGGLFGQRMEGTVSVMTSGCLLMMAILVGVGFLIAPGTSRRLRWALAAALVPLLIGIVMIMTRSALSGLVAGLGALLLMVRPRLFAGFAAALAVIVVVVLLQHDRFPATGPLSRLDPDYLLHDKNTTLRLEMWRGGWAMAKRHPLTGVGDRGLELISPRYYTSEGGYYFGHLHSNIPHMAAIWGFPGLLFAQGFLFAGLWYLVRRWRALRRQPGGAAASPAAAGWALGAVGVWAGFFVAGLTDWYFGDAEPMLLYLAIVGAGLGGRLPGHSPAAGTSPAD